MSENYLACGEIETSSHALWSCCVARAIWKLTGVAAFYRQYRFLDVKECVWMALSDTREGKLEVLENVIYWLWRARCAVVFEGCLWEVEQVIERAVQQDEMFQRLHAQQQCVT